MQHLDLTSEIYATVVSNTAHQPVKQPYVAI